MLKFALLGFLLRQSMTGYDLAAVIRNSINFVWPAQLSQIYRTLGQLEDDGLVVSEVIPQQGRPDRRVYSATDAGRQAFESWVGELVTELDPIRVPFLVRFFFGGTRPPQDLVTQLRVMRDLHVKARDQLAEELPGYITNFAASTNATELDPLIWDSVRRAGEMVAQTWVDWVDETIERLEQAAEKSPPTDG
ncbi:Transcriptional regulator PadR-like family protein [Actinomadura rubteroloni]|uniref:Transcriptional regulator PadR-like family protein n=1 Tax=Actinomadura rubteroloni TaxID=1926885 RepID=A0A2P4UN28_9ACTN|nr:PadR family transcriptional regulator [Actinomadura rubteroloni]POM26454.1 Transcriptional regulator PadR-like family protein [Actinomadura rubteroloni]